MVARDIHCSVRFEIEFDERDLFEIVDWYNESSPRDGYQIVHEPLLDTTDFFYMHKDGEVADSGFYLGDLANACVMWVLEYPEHFSTFVDVRDRTWSNGGNMDGRFAQDIVDMMVSEIL